MDQRDHASPSLKSSVWGQRRRYIGRVAVAMIVVLLLASLWAFLCCPVLGGLFMGILMSMGESVNQTVPSPAGDMAVLVVSDGCGATCACTVRIDLRTTERYFKEIYRVVDSCDVTVTWLDSTTFRIVDRSGVETVIDLRALEIIP